MKLASLSLLALAAFAGPAEATSTVFDTGNGARTTVYDNYDEWLSALQGTEPLLEDFSDDALVTGVYIDNPSQIRGGQVNGNLRYGTLSVGFSLSGLSAIGFDYAESGAIEGIGFNLFAGLSDGAGFSYRPTSASGFLGMITNRSFDNLSISGRSGYGYRTMTIDNMRVAYVAAPEPASWAMMVGGFGLIGGALRTGRKRQVRFA
jgi:hypothetical protein